MTRVVMSLALLAVVLSRSDDGLHDRRRAAHPSLSPAAAVDMLAYGVGPASGRWHHARDGRERDFEPRNVLDVEALEQLGYAAGVHEAPPRAGVTTHDRGRVEDGLNLVLSAHAAEAALVDLNGTTRHRWRVRFEDAFPGHVARGKTATFWRRAALLPGGDLIAIYDGLGIVRVDQHSRVRWASAAPAHHDLVVAEGESVWTLTRRPIVVPSLHKTRPSYLDFVTRLGAEGEEIEQISILEALERSELVLPWRERLPPGGDVLHTNSLVRLDGSWAKRVPEFASGCFLISIRVLDLIAVLDPKQRRITWAMMGPFKAQHDPRPLDDGRLLLFDNLGLGGRSRVMEIDVVTRATRWSYEGNAHHPFFSQTCGTAQRLTNGNTLITESDFGRALEVTGGGEVVWEYLNPHRAGPNGKFIATLMEVRRLPRAAASGWLD